MLLKYREEIQTGDHVTFAGSPATIELVATPPGDHETEYYVEEFGGGVMILAPEPFSRIFVSADQIDDTEDLEFVSRAEIP